MTFFEMVDPQSMFDFVFDAFQNEEMTLENCNIIGMNMPEGYGFQFVGEDEF